MPRQQNEAKKEPVERFTAWTGTSRVEVAVWENEKGHSVSFNRSWKDKEDKWQTSHSLFPQDILPLMELLRESWQFVQSSPKD